MSDFNKYQKKAVETAQYADAMYPIVSLVVEAAEFADLFVKPILRGDEVPITSEDIMSEAGDVLWNLANALSDWDLTLQEVADYNIAKVNRRVTDGTIQGSGNR